MTNREFEYYQTKDRECEEAHAFAAAADAASKTVVVSVVPMLLLGGVSVVVLR